MATSSNSSVSRNRLANYGTSIDQLGGITLSSTILLVNMDTDRRSTTSGLTLPR